MLSETKKPDEPWISYLLRLLNEEGIGIVEESFDQSLGLEAIIKLNCGLVLYRLTDTEQKHDFVRATTYDELGRLVTDRVGIQFGQDLHYSSMLYLDFSSGGNVTVWDWEFKETAEVAKSTRFSDYKLGEEYEAMPVIEDILQHARETKIKFERKEGEKKDSEKTQSNAVKETSMTRPKHQAPAQGTDKLDKILSIVQRIESRQEGHRINLLSDQSYLRQLYLNAINEDPNNLRIFEYEGKKIPYVLVDSSQLEGHTGRVTDNLYFVAKDKAPEEWQQQVVAFHESLCNKEGHEHARQRELDVVRHLGKEGEYQVWRKEQGLSD